MRRPTALTVAGSDSSGGAGIQADLKVFHQHGVYGTSAITLVTAQNTERVDDVLVLPGELVQKQILCVLADLGALAAKTGALGSSAIVERVAGCFRRYPEVPLVVDPVMLSKPGRALLDDDALPALKKQLLPRATLFTPNVPEACALLDGEITTERELGEAARALAALGPRAVLLKGGHLDGPRCTDVLFDGERLHVFVSDRVAGPHTHGTGCTLAAAITARLALGASVLDAVTGARAYVARAIASAPGLGHGHGPVDHWAETALKP